MQDVWRAGQFTIRPGVRYDSQKLVGNLADFTFGNNWAPRLGLTWDPSNSGRVKVFGNFGLFYARIPNDLAARALSADAGVTRAELCAGKITPVAPAPSALRQTAPRLCGSVTWSRHASNGSSWASSPGSTCPCGETIGSYFMVFNTILNFDNLGAGRKLDAK